MNILFGYFSLSFKFALKRNVQFTNLIAMNTYLKYVFRVVLCTDSEFESSIWVQHNLSEEQVKLVLCVANVININSSQSCAWCKKYDNNWGQICILDVIVITNSKIFVGRLNYEIAEVIFVNLKIPKLSLSLISFCNCQKIFFRAKLETFKKILKRIDTRYVLPSFQYVD